MKSGVFIIEYQTGSLAYRWLLRNSLLWNIMFDLWGTFLAQSDKNRFCAWFFLEKATMISNMPSGIGVILKVLKRRQWKGVWGKSSRRRKRSLRSWRYCVIKVLAAESRSKISSADEAFEVWYFSRIRRQLTRLVQRLRRQISLA